MEEGLADVDASKIEEGQEQPPTEAIAEGDPVAVVDGKEGEEKTGDDEKQEDEDEDEEEETEEERLERLEEEHLERKAARSEKRKADRRKARKERRRQEAIAQRKAKWAAEKARRIEAAAAAKRGEPPDLAESNIWLFEFYDRCVHRWHRSEAYRRLKRAEAVYAEKRERVARKYRKVDYRVRKYVSSAHTKPAPLLSPPALLL